MNAGGRALYDAILSRRVTRHMTAEPVDPVDLDLVLRAARAAPNAGNRRLQPVVGVGDPVLLGLLRLVAPGMLPRPGAAAVICVDHRRAEAYGFGPGTPGLFIDVGTAAATMLLAAESLGLAACPVTSFSRAAVGRLLHLGDGVIPRLIICLGHAAADQPASMPVGPAGGSA